MARHLALALALVLPACDDDIDCATIPRFTEMRAWDKCTSCHDSKLTDTSRNAAPEGINYDNYADAKANATAAMSEIEEGAMPLPGSPPFTAAEKTQISDWVRCDTPQ